MACATWIRLQSVAHWTLLISLAVVLWEMSARGWLVGVALWLCSVLLLDWRLAWWSCCLMMSE